MGTGFGHVACKEKQSYTQAHGKENVFMCFSELNVY